MKIEDMRLLWRGRADQLVEDKLGNVQAELSSELRDAGMQKGLVDALLPVLLDGMIRAIKAGFQAGAEFEFERGDRGADALEDAARQWKEEAERLPLGQAHISGGLHNAPAYDVMMFAVRKAEERAAELRKKVDDGT